MYKALNKLSVAVSCVWYVALLLFIYLCAVSSAGDKWEELKRVKVHLKLEAIAERRRKRSRKEKRRGRAGL